MRYLLFLLILTALIAPVESAAASEEAIELRTVQVGMTPHGDAEERLPRLQFMGGLALGSTDSRFGGLSGLMVLPDGHEIIAVSDRGHWFRASLVHDAQGRLVDLRNGVIAPILGEDGVELTRKAWRDAEAVEATGQGTVLIGFERHHRLARYDVVAQGFRARARIPHILPGLTEMGRNRGIEAVAVMWDGRIVAFAEGPDEPGRTGIPAWLIDGARVRRLRLEPTPPFRPTDAAGLPNGDILLLERRFSTIGGFGARLSIIDGGQVASGAKLTTREIARFEPPLTVDNFEGVAVAEAPSGGLAVYILSDDNFRLLQRTLLLMFILR